MPIAPKKIFFNGNAMTDGKNRKIFALKNKNAIKIWGHFFSWHFLVFLTAYFRGFACLWKLPIIFTVFAIMSLVAKPLKIRGNFFSWHVLLSIALHFLSFAHKRKLHKYLLSLPIKMLMVMALIIKGIVLSQVFFWVQVSPSILLLF